MAIVYPVRCCCGSWACQCCGSKLGDVLAGRLTYVAEQAKLKGLVPVLLSLTLDRKRWADPRSAWDGIRDRRGVCRCVKAFCEAYGVPYRRRFLIKMELQQAGWPHWHVFLLVPAETEFPKKDAVTPFWPFGFSNLLQGVRSVSYLAKYAAAGECGGPGLRASGLPSRGVHWVSPSKGFWAEWGLGELDVGRIVCEDAEELEEEDQVDQEEEGGELLADRVERCAGFCVLRCVEEDGEERTYVVPFPRSWIAQELELLTGGSERRTFYPSGALRWVTLPLEVLEVFVRAHQERGGVVVANSFVYGPEGGREPLQWDGGSGRAGGSARPCVLEG